MTGVSTSKKAKSGASFANSPSPSSPVQLARNAEREIELLKAKLHQRDNALKESEKSIHRLSIEYQDYKSRSILREDVRLISSELKLIKERYAKLQTRYDDLVVQDRSEKTVNDAMLRILKDSPEKYMRVFQAIVEFATPEPVEGPVLVPEGIHQRRNEKRRLKRREERSRLKLQNFKERKGIFYSIKKLSPANNVPPKNNLSAAANDPRLKDPSSAHRRNRTWPVDMDDDSSIQEKGGSSNNGGETGLSFVPSKDDSSEIVISSDEG